jgi:aspartyl-tRNA(Asn)/glutamyl-tRNA(Gln) amidotransferase subunit B
MLANWISGDLFGLLNQTGTRIELARIPPQALADLVEMVANGEINQTTAKSVLVEMFTSGRPAGTIVGERGLRQITEPGTIAGLVEQVLSRNRKQVEEYLAGKETITRWLFGQVMRAAKGQANPQIVQQELERQLEALRVSRRS